VGRQWRQAMWLLAKQKLAFVLLVMDQMELL
jgi:hypothetical protein